MGALALPLDSSREGQTFVAIRGQNLAAAAAADLELDHFTEPCEKERYRAEYGEDRYPGTFGDFQVRSPQLPPQSQWHAPLTVLTGDAIG
jgi:hypothetical protein